MIDAFIERPRSHSAYARMPLQLLRVRVDPWLELLEDSFELARMSVLGTGHDVAALEERLWASGASWSRLLRSTSRRPVRGSTSCERLAVLNADARPCAARAPSRSASSRRLCEEVSFAAGERCWNAAPPERRLRARRRARRGVEGESSRGMARLPPGQTVCGVTAFGEGRGVGSARRHPHASARFRVDDWFDVMEENFEMVRATLRSLALALERLGGRL